MEVRPLRMYLLCDLLPFPIVLLKNYLENFNLVLFTFVIRTHVDLLNQSHPVPLLFYCRERECMCMFVSRKIL